MTENTLLLEAIAERQLAKVRATALALRANGNPEAAAPFEELGALMGDRLAAIRAGDLDRVALLTLAVYEMQDDMARALGVAP